MTQSWVLTENSKFSWGRHRNQNLKNTIDDVARKLINIKVIDRVIYFKEYDLPFVIDFRTQIEYRKYFLNQRKIYTILCIVNQLNNIVPVFILLIFRVKFMNV